MNWQDLSKGALTVLKTVAPTAATALGGPLAGLAVAELEKTFGGDAKAADSVIAASSPDTLLKLKTLEAGVRQHMADLQVTEDQLAYADTASARGREQSVRDWTPRILAYLIIAATAAIGVLVLNGKVDMANATQATLVGTVVGYIFGEAKQVCSYYFGSSAGSKAKDATIADIASNGQGG